MFSKKNIIVTIGDRGAVVALHENNQIKNKFFLDELSDAAKTELKDLFTKNESAQVYILLDTIDQIYKKKIYPSVRGGDLARIIRRDINSDGDKESFKNYFILNPKKSPFEKTPPNHRWESMFVSASNSPTITQWIEFLLEMPNRLVGIYMLPLEAFNLLNAAKSKIDARSKVKNKKNHLYCFVIQNKVSGTRQIVFSEQGMVFTRVVNYNFEQKDFLEKYEQDIYSTFEYLKRIFPTLSIDELDIVNVFPDDVLKIFGNIQNIELTPINYTPLEMAKEVGCVLPQDSHFCDLLISKIFSEKKKLLKFTTPKIHVLDRFFIALKASNYLNIGLVALICVALLTSFFIQHSVNNSIKSAELLKDLASQNYVRLKETALDDSQLSEADKAIDVERVMDLGKMEETIGSIGTSFAVIYSKLKFVKDFNVKLDEFYYYLSGFNNKSPSVNSDYSIIFKGNLSNKSGDIEDLFREFDIFTNEVKKNLNKNQIKYSELPRNIDFNRKYYSFPIDFTISKNK